MIKKNSNKISGWIILDKQYGITSRQAVSKISKIFKLKKVGHGGTLDPLATGVLPIALGEATKLISFIQKKKKKYSFTIKWGEATDTDDIEGMILKKSNSRPNKKEIQSALQSFTGKIHQIPPNFSAIKINKDLERIGDHATNIAKRVAVAERVLPEKPSRDIINMGEKVNIMISEVIKAFLEFSDEDAKKVWLMDREIDEEYLGILRQLLTYMMEEPKRITACTSLLYMVKNLERMGDYVQNIAEDIYYAVSGEPLFDGSSDPTWEAILPKKK